MITIIIIFNDLTLFISMCVVFLSKYRNHYCIRNRGGDEIGLMKLSNICYIKSIVENNKFFNLFFNNYIFLRFFDWIFELFGQCGFLLFLNFLNKNKLSNFLIFKKIFHFFVFPDIYNLPNYLVLLVKDVKCFFLLLSSLMRSNFNTQL
jgi:hypothetical protein